MRISQAGGGHGHPGGVQSWERDYSIGMQVIWEGFPEEAAGRQNEAFKGSSGKGPEKGKPGCVWGQKGACRLGVAAGGLERPASPEAPRRTPRPTPRARRSPPLSASLTFVLTSGVISCCVSLRFYRPSRSRRPSEPSVSFESLLIYRGPRPL